MNSPAASASLVARVERLARRLRSQYDVTRLWNWIDHQPIPEPLFDVLLIACPWAFCDPHDVNSVRFEYDRNTARSRQPQTFRDFEMTKLIESENVDRDHGMTGTNAIVEAESGERYLICDGFGGVDSLEGGAVRWKHGTVYHLQCDDTLELLHSTDWNETTTLWEAVTRGFDGSRPVVLADPENMAKSAGLA